MRIAIQYGHAGQVRITLPSSETDVISYDWLRRPTYVLDNETHVARYLGECYTDSAQYLELKDLKPWQQALVTQLYLLYDQM